MHLALFRSNRPCAVAVVGDGVGVGVHIRGGGKIVGTGEDGNDRSGIDVVNAAFHVHRSAECQGDGIGVCLIVANRISAAISVQRAVRHGGSTKVIQRIAVIRIQRAVLNGKGTEVTYRIHISSVRNSTVFDCADDIRLNLD